MRVIPHANLQEELFAIKQGDMTITSYFTRLNTVWEELENFCPILGCPFIDRCVCGLEIVRGYRKDDYVV